MVEGGQIDWRGHTNDALGNMANTLGLDESVDIGINYAFSNANVLLIVTADHETGGMSATLTPSGSLTEDGPFTTPDLTKFYVDWTTLSHTGIDVPTTSMGPEAAPLIGVFENTRIFDTMKMHINN